MQCIESSTTGTVPWLKESFPFNRDAQHTGSAAETIKAKRPPHHFAVLQYNSTTTVESGSDLLVLLLKSLSTLCESVGIAELSFDQEFCWYGQPPTLCYKLETLWIIYCCHLYFLSGAFLPPPRLLLWGLSGFWVLVFDTERGPEVLVFDTARCPEVFVFGTALVGCCPELLVREVSETVRWPGGGLPPGGRVWCTGLSWPKAGDASEGPPGPATVAIEV